MHQTRGQSRFREIDAGKVRDFDDEEEALEPQYVVDKQAAKQAKLVTPQEDLANQDEDL